VRSSRARASNVSGVHPTRKPLVGSDRFGTLLVFLLASFLLSGINDSGWYRVFGATLNVAALLAGVAATDLWNHRTRIVALTTIGVLGIVLLGSFSQTSVPAGIGALAQVIVLGAILVAVVRRVLTHELVELSTILGAVAAYFLIGLVFAWVYLAFHGFLDGPLLEPAENGLPAYYSFVVLSTLGFGDITPVDELVQRVTAVEAITGQIFLATLVARLVSMYKPSPRPE